MITDTFARKVALYAAGTSSSYPTHLSVGSGTAPATQFDSELASYQDSVEVSGEVNQQILAYKAKVPFVIGTPVVTNELGLFDGAGEGHECFMRQHTNAWSRGENENYLVTSFVYLKPATNSAVNLIHQSLASRVNSKMVGETTTLSHPSEFVAGALSFLDRCESLGTAPNEWQGSTNATIPVLNTVEGIEGEYCINLGKSGTGSSVVTYSRTLPSPLDYSKAELFSLYFNINSSESYFALKETGCVVVKFGTDSANYYSYSFNRNNLLVGWQSPNISIADMTITGTPSLNQIQYLEISFETFDASITVDSGGWAMDYWTVYMPISFEDAEMNNPLATFPFSSGYPRISNTSIKWQGFLAKDVGNTYNYQFIGLKSGSGTSEGFLEMQSVINYRIQKDQYKQVTAEANLNIQNDKFSE